MGVSKNDKIIVNACSNHSVNKERQRQGQVGVDEWKQEMKAGE